MQEVMTWLNNGLAVVIVVAVGMASWRVATWLGSHVIIPLKDAAITHLDRTNNHLEHTGEIMEKHAEVMVGLDTTIKDLHEDVREIKTQLGSGCRYQ